MITARTIFDTPDKILEHPAAYWLRGLGPWLHYSHWRIVDGAFETISSTSSVNARRTRVRESSLGFDWHRKWVVAPSDGLNKVVMVLQQLSAYFDSTTTARNSSAFRVRGQRSQSLAR